MYGLDLTAPSTPRQTDGAAWRVRLVEEIQQNPLIETRLSLSLTKAAHPDRRPGAVLVGIGLCRQGEISAGLPLDVLGLLLPAEGVRRAVGATRLYVLLADAHALSTGIPPLEVERQVRRILVGLAALRRVGGFHDWQILRASRLAGRPAYRALLGTVARAGGARDNEYVHRQITDVALFHCACEGIIKVGWSIGASPRVRGRKDEVAFDRRYRQVMGDGVDFVYCKAGRTLYDGRPKAAPYLTRDPAVRLLLHPGEDLRAKLRPIAGRTSPETLAGVRNHLRRITRLYARLGHPLAGPLEQRAQKMLDQIFSLSPSPRP